jgi:hypothetical protein
LRFEFTADLESRPRANCHFNTYYRPLTILFLKTSYLRYPKAKDVAKKNVLDFGTDHSATVIGIASNDKIWKICWKLNQALAINLATAEDDVTRVKGPVLYTDFDADPHFEYTFFENHLKPSQGTKLSRQFRYWLVISSKKEEEVDAQSFLQKIGTIDIVSLAHNLSEEKDIKKLLP